MALNYYTGPGKLFYNSKGFQADGENGPIKIDLDEKTTTRSTAMFGRQLETVDSQSAKISVTPFDNWLLLPTLFPAFLGVSTDAIAGGAAGALAIGTRPHTNSNVPAKVWTQDGRLYHAVRAAITKHPNMKFGNGQPLYGGIELRCLGDLAKDPGDTSWLFNANAITESGASDPGGAMTLADFANGVWRGAWGTYAGFGGDAGTPMQAEDFWELVTDVKYDTMSVQKVERQMKLASVGFMLKCRLVGPTHTQLLGKILAHTAGQSLGAADLTLSGPSNRTVILQNAEVKGAGFEFGGTKLGTGEVGFVAKMGFNTNTVASGTPGAPDPLLIFSA